MTHDEWFLVEHRDTGTRYWAKVLAVTTHFDCGYTSWTIPNSYRVADAEVNGFILEPNMNKTRVLRYEEFWRQFKPVREGDVYA